MNCKWKSTNTATGGGGSLLSYLVFLIVSMRGDVLFCTDGISKKFFTKQTEESPDWQKELGTCSKTHKQQFKPTCYKTN